MRDIRITVTDRTAMRSTDTLGRAGEINATRLLIDVTAWAPILPTGAVFSLIIKRGDGVTWPALAAAVPIDGVIAYIAEAADTAVNGSVAMELTAEATDGTVIKSAQWYMTVAAALEAGDPPAQPEPSWLDQIITAAAELAQRILQALGLLPEIEAVRDDVADMAQGVEADKLATDSYMLRAEDAAEAAEDSAGAAASSAALAANNILNGVTVHNASAAAHDDIREDVQRVEAIARGRATAYVFNTYADMLAWLTATENVSNLVTGDNLYIRDTGVKDYWWDGEAAQELEAEAPDLTDYYTKSQVDAMMPVTLSRSEYNALAIPEAGRVYNVWED